MGRFFRRQVSITREGWGYALLLGFVLAGALTRQMNLLIILFGMMVGPVIFSWRITANVLRRLEVRRKAPAAISAGDLLVVEVEVSNPRRRMPSWAVVVEDTIDRIVPAGLNEPWDASILFPYIAPGEARNGAYRGRLMRRGLYRFGPITLVTRFPLGLLERRVVVEDFADLIVYPRLGTLMPQWRQLGMPTETGSRKARPKQGVVEGPFYGLRDWRPGDSRRWIHWRSSARRNELVVRQFEQQQNQDLTLVVELWRPTGASAEELERVETAISFAATVVEDVCREGGVQIVVSIGGAKPNMISGPASQPLLQEILQALALADPTSEDRLPEAMQAALQETDPWTRIVVVSTRPVDLTRPELQETHAGRRDIPFGAIQCFDASRSDLNEHFVLD